MGKISLYSTLVCLLVMSYEDVKEGEINPVFLIGLCGFRYLFAYVLLAFFYIFYDRWSTKIGGADIWILCLLLSKVGPQGLMKILLVSSLCGIIACAFAKKREIRFIPFIFLGFCIVRFMPL